MSAPEPTDLLDRMMARAERAEESLEEMLERSEREHRTRLEGIRTVLDHAAVAVLLADSQRQLAMTWGAELANALEVERRCHAIDLRNVRAGIEPFSTPVRKCGPGCCEHIE